MEQWLQDQYVSQETRQKLHREMIRKKSDLKLMMEKDITGLNLPLGEAIRLREAIDRLHREQREMAQGGHKQTTHGAEGSGSP